MSMLKLSDWYQVRFDDRRVYREVAPPGGEAWADEFVFEDVVRVCFYTQELFASDELYVFTRGRDESYQIPTEAGGGRELLDELVRRGLFPAEMLIEAVTTENRLFCHPPVEATPDGG
jgi:hypothetical protein